MTNFEAHFRFQTNKSTKPENVKPDMEKPEAKGCTNSEANIQTVFNLIDVFNESVIDIRLGEDETNLKAEITGNLTDFVDKIDHSSGENVETKAWNKDDVLNNAISIDTTVDMAVINIINKVGQFASDFGL